MATTPARREPGDQGSDNTIAAVAPYIAMTSASAQRDVRIGKLRRGGWYTPPVHRASLQRSIVLTANVDTNSRDAPADTREVDHANARLTRFTNSCAQPTPAPFRRRYPD